MAAGGLTKFIHGTRQGTNASARKIPQKLVLEDANKVYKYTSTEPSDSSTRRGAFSTDLGSYPDTSLDDIQDQVGGSEPPRSTSNPLERREGSLVFRNSGKTIETDTVTSTQQGVHPSHGRRAESIVPLEEQDAAISALIGADNVQDYEEFLQTWTANEEHSERLLGNEPQVVPVVLANRRPNARLSIAPPSTSSGILQTQAHIQKPSGSVLDQLQQSSSKDNVVQNENSRELLFRPLRRVPAETVFKSQAAPQNNTATNQLSRNQDQNPTTKTRSAEQEISEHDTLLSYQHRTSGQPSNEHSISDRWSLKRTANLDSVKLDMSEQQLLSMQYSSLDQEDGPSGESDSAAFFSDLDQIITSITNQTSDEETLLSHLSQLSQAEWAALGDKIHSKQGDLVNDLKNLYTKKQDVSKQYQQETRDMMRQIANNDKIVANKLQRLRSLGAQILNDKSPME